MSGWLKARQTIVTIIASEEGGDAYSQIDILGNAVNPAVKYGLLKGEALLNACRRKGEVVEMQFYFVL